MASLTPVDFDPFAAPVQRAKVPEGVTRVTVNAPGPKLVPVDHDPFAGPTMTDRAAGVGKAFDAGVARGIAGLGGVLGDLTNYGASAIGSATNFVERQLGLPETPAPDRSNSILNKIPTSASLQQAIQHEFYNDAAPYEPQNRLEKYARTIGEFAPAAAGGGGGLIQRGAQVVLPAVASETAGQLTEGGAAEPWARLGGALVGGGVSALASRPSTAATALRGQLPEGVTPQMVDQAQALMAQARQQGIDLAWPEALSQVAQRPVLTNTMRNLEGAPQTEAQMAEFFARRPQQVEQAARGQFDQFAPANPAPSTIGRQVGQAAEGEITDTRQAINAASQPYYDAAALTPISAADMARVRAVPGYDIARRAIARDPQLSRYVQGLPENSVGYVNEIKKYLDQAAENAAGPMNAQRNMQRSAGFGQDAALMRQTGINNSTDYQIALAIQQQGREQFLQPLLDGYIGKLAKGDVTTQNAINALFPKNPLPNSQAEIADTVGRLARRNPRAATDLVRAHIESTFNQAAKDLQTGANQAGGAKFRAQLIADPQQRANLRAAVEALPNGAQRWQGFNRFLDILEATGTRRGIGSNTAYNEQFFKEAAKGGIAGDLVKTGANPLSMGQRFVDRYQQWRMGRNLGQLANILTDPGSANMLRAIANAPNERAASAIALRLVTYNNASRRSEPVDKSGK